MNFEQSYKALRHWVTESTKSNKINGNALTIEQRIQNLLNASQPLKREMIVYRGHGPDSPRIYSNRGWFSTSSDINKVLRQHVSDDTTCCLFKIHVLPGIKCINVDATIERAGLEKTGYDESEIILNGGGTFYANPELTKVGFKEIEPAERITNITTGRVIERMEHKRVFGHLVKHKYKTENITQYETWYSTKVPPAPPPIKNMNTIKTMINGINDEQIEFITEPKNLIDMYYITEYNLSDKTNTNKEEIKARINARKNPENAKKATSGGRRKTRKQYRKSRKTRKSPN